MYDNIYGGPPVDALLDAPSLTHTDGNPSSSYNTLDLPPDSFLPWYNNAKSTSHPARSGNAYMTTATPAGGSATSLTSDAGTSRTMRTAPRSVGSLEELHSPMYDDYRGHDWGSVSTSSDGCYAGVVMVGDHQADGNVQPVEPRTEEMVPGMTDGGWWAWVMEVNGER